MSNLPRSSFVRVKAAQIAWPLVAVILFSLALRVLYSELQGARYENIAEEFGRLPWRDIALAALFTFLSYLVLTFYDVLAIKYVKVELPYPKIAAASFIGYTLSHNLGFPLFTGGAARFRLFSSWGMSPQQIAQAIGFSGLLFWVGFAALAGVVYLYDPPVVPEHFGVPVQVLRLIGVLSLLLVVCYFVFFVFRKRPFRLKDWEVDPPPFGLSVAGMIVAAIDWCFAAAVAFVILPDTGMSSIQFLGLFQLGQFAGLISHIPGGLGVFEATVLAFLTGRAPPEQVMGALLAYRIIYYLVPLAFSCSLLLLNEVVCHRERLARLFGDMIRRVSPVLPLTLSVALFLCGLILLFSGATPPVEARFRLLQEVIPLEVLEASHFAGSAVGIGLILLSRGIVRRLDAVYGLSTALLLLGVAASLLKGLDYEEALVLAVMLVVLRASRRYFYRRAPLLAEPFQPAWMAGVVSVLIATGWLVLFAYKHIEYDPQLWWQFELDGHAARSLRAAAGAVIICLVWLVAEVLVSARSEGGETGAEELQAVSNIVSHASFSHACLALLGDKNLIFSSTKRSFIMFAIEGKSCVAFGDPVGVRPEYPELIWEFREMCDRHTSDCVFYHVRHEFSPLYLDAGLSLLKLREEAFVSLPDFSLSGRCTAEFRSNKNRFEREGYSTEVVGPDATSPLLPVLEEISADWGGRSFDRLYLQRLPLAVVRRHGEVVAFANVWFGEDKDELALDVVRHRQGLLGGIFDYLLIDLMLWGKQQGGKRFSLGTVPRSTSEKLELEGLWKAGNGTSHGAHFFDFQRAVRYGEKFQTIWEARYLAFRGEARLPKVLSNITTLISKA